MFRVLIFWGLFSELVIIQNPRKVERNLLNEVDRFQTYFPQNQNRPSPSKIGPGLGGKSNYQYGSFGGWNGVGRVMQRILPVNEETFK